MAENSYDMPDIRLRDSVSTWGTIFLTILGLVVFFWAFPDEDSQLQGFILGAILVLVFSLGRISDVACRQRSTVGMTEIAIRRSVLAITWKRERIAVSEVRKIHFGWRQEQPPKKPRRLWPVRLKLRDRSLVPVAAGATVAEAEELAEQLAAYLDVPRNSKLGNGENQSLCQ